MDRRSFVRSCLVVSMLAAPPVVGAGDGAPRSPGVLTLAEATARALRHHPELRASALEVEAHLPAEGGERAGAGAVALRHAVIEDVAEQVEVLLHGRNLARTSGGGMGQLSCLPNQR